MNLETLKGMVSSLGGEFEKVQSGVLERKELVGKQQVMKKLYPNAAIYIGLVYCCVK